MMTANRRSPSAPLLDAVVCPRLLTEQLGNKGQPASPTVRNPMIPDGGSCQDPDGSLGRVIGILACGRYPLGRHLKLAPGRRSTESKICLEPRAGSQAVSASSAAGVTKYRDRRWSEQVDGDPPTWT